MATGRTRIHCVRYALLSTGGPIFESIVASSAGMLALMMSNFGPTSRFGLLMAVLLTATLTGTLVLLPCLLSLGRSDVRRKALRPRTAGFVPACHLQKMPVDHVA
jgi:predicted RND superfamily exporter protein